MILNEIKNIRFKKVSILFLLICLMFLTFSSVSAAEVTVNNSSSWTVDKVQSLIDGNTEEGQILNEGDTLKFSQGDYNWNKGLHINKSYNIVADGKVNLIGTGIDLTKASNLSTKEDFGFHITASYVNISGFSIEGFYYGISINDTSNVKLTNNIIHNNRRGINSVATDVIIENNQIIDNDREGINFNGQGMLINGNTISYNGFEAIHGHAKNSLISNNLLEYNGFGSTGTSTMPAIDLHGHADDVRNMTVDNNIIRYNGVGVILSISNGKITNNLISNNIAQGIIVGNSLVYPANDNIISNNKIYNNGGNAIDIKTDNNSVSNNDLYRDSIPANASAGINITANNINITGNSIQGFYYGVSTTNTSDNVKIANNNIHDNRRGINSLGNNVLIENNIVNNNLREGINFNGNRATLKGNIINGNGFEGIHGHATNSLISANILEGNGHAGPSYGFVAAAVDLHGHAEATNNMTFDSNIVRNNVGAGVYISISNGKVSNNQIYNNGDDGLVIGAYSTYISNNNIIDSNKIYNNKGNYGILNNGINTKVTNNEIYNNAGTEVKNNGSNLVMSDNTIDKVRQNTTTTTVTPTKKPADLAIAKIKRSKNYYYITVKNSGQTKSTTTYLRISYKKGKKTYTKKAKVKAINPGKSLTIKVKFYKYSTHKKYKKTVEINYNYKTNVVESNYNNNVKKFKV